MEYLDEYSKQERIYYYILLLASRHEFSRDVRETAFADTISDCAVFFEEKSTNLPDSR